MGAGNLGKPAQIKPQGFMPDNAGIGILHLQAVAEAVEILLVNTPGGEEGDFHADSSDQPQSVSQGLLTLKESSLLWGSFSPYPQRKVLLMGRFSDN